MGAISWIVDLLLYQEEALAAEEEQKQRRREATQEEKDLEEEEGLTDEVRWGGLKDSRRPIGMSGLRVP